MTSFSKHSLNKGELAEEALRDYFFSLGFFVIRGVKFCFQGYTITDIDLWLYNKNSTLTREIINVDVKRKRTPQAIERIFWTKGLQHAISCTRCVVVTTDKRPATKNFGELLDVTVLDGTFVARLIENLRIENRLTENDFLSILNHESFLDPKLNWKNKYEEAKSNLILTLNFNGFNQFWKDAKFAIEDYLASSLKNEASLRIFYVFLAFALICLDYKSRIFAPLSTQDRIVTLIQGFRYGETGEKRTKEILDAAISLAEHVSNNMFIKEQLHKEIEVQLKKYPAENIATFFSKSNILKNLFSYSKMFYENAFAIQVTSPSRLPPDLKAIIGVFIDHHKLDRKKIL